MPVGSWKSWVFWQIAPVTPSGMSATFDGDVFNGVDAWGGAARIAGRNRIEGWISPGVNRTSATLDLSGRRWHCYRVSTDGATWSD